MRMLWWRKTSGMELREHLVILDRTFLTCCCGSKKGRIGFWHGEKSLVNLQVRSIYFVGENSGVLLHCRFIWWYPGCSKPRTRHGWDASMQTQTQLLKFWRTINCKQKCGIPHCFDIQLNSLGQANLTCPGKIAFVWTHHCFSLLYLWPLATIPANPFPHTHTTFLSLAPLLINFEPGCVCFVLLLLCLPTFSFNVKDMGSAWTSIEPRDAASWKEKSAMILGSFTSFRWWPVNLSTTRKNYGKKGKNIWDLSHHRLIWWRKKTKMIGRLQSSLIVSFN